MTDSLTVELPWRIGSQLNEMDLDEATNEVMSEGWWLMYDGPNSERDFDYELR